jgi:RHH-type proline utilization regulon transcriptional repressor/proline dehydrogenase/delta 1-pyrroline-5-carboxylate dehydrogenase
VLGVMRADDLAHAVRLQNGTPFGLTGGIHSLADDEIRYWLDHVEVGNAYVNRHITGAVVRRQPFGGWKRSSLGGAPKAGGPHYVHALLRPVAAPIDVDASTQRYREAWRDHFAARDVSGLRSESNRLRHLPVAGVVVRAGDDTPPGAVDAAIAAASQCGVAMAVSNAAGESEDVLAARLPGLGATRLRALTALGDGLAAACHALDIVVDCSPVSADAMLELPHWLREQAISETTHRYGLIRRRPGS